MPYSQEPNLKKDLQSKAKILQEIQAKPFQEQDASKTNNLQKLFNSGDLVASISNYPDHISLGHFAIGRIDDIRAAMDSSNFSLSKLFNILSDSNYNLQGIYKNDNFSIPDMYIFFGDRLNPDFLKSKYKSLSDKQLDRYFQVMVSLAGRYAKYLDTNFKNNSNKYVREQYSRTIQAWFKYTFLVLGFNATDKLKQVYSFKGSKKPLYQIIAKLAFNYPEEFKNIIIDSHTIEKINEKVGYDKSNRTSIDNNIKSKLPIIMERAEGIHKYFVTKLNIE